jgi:hypothetical protein
MERQLVVQPGNRPSGLTGVAGRLTRARRGGLA